MILIGDKVVIKKKIINMSGQSLNIGDRAMVTGEYNGYTLSSNGIVISCCDPKDFTSEEGVSVVDCPVCDSVMQPRRSRTTYAWFCTGDTCPCILFEYLDDSNINELKQLIR